MNSRSVEFETSSAHHTLFCFFAISPAPPWVVVVVAVWQRVVRDMVPRGAQRQRRRQWNPAAAIALPPGQRLPVAVADPGDDPLRQRARTGAGTTAAAKPISTGGGARCSPFVGVGRHDVRRQLLTDRSSGFVEIQRPDGRMWRRTPAAQLFDVWRILPLCQRVAQMLRTRVSQLFERKREMCGLFILFYFFFLKMIYFFSGGLTGLDDERRQWGGDDWALRGSLIRWPWAKPSTLFVCWLFMM